MSKIMLNTLFFAAVVGCSSMTGNIFAQEVENPVRRVNFVYSQNPKTKTKSGADENKNKPANSEVSSKVGSQTNDKINETAPNVSIAKKTYEIAKRASSTAVSPTEIYKVGVGDILFISLQNAPSNSSNYFTVLNDGTIDYALAGQMLAVADFTTEEIEDLLKEKIKLFENPQISVKVREHSSHSINVLGLVEKPGEKYLPREAMPMFFVRAEAVVQPKANQAYVKHRNGESEIFDLNDSKNDNILIFPGDIIEFKASENNDTVRAETQFFYIGGNIMSVGQKDFHSGLTLTQAVLASGGLRKATAKKIVIRRKNIGGLLIPTEFDFRAIQGGKAPDPVIQAGDTIEVGN